MKKIIVLILCLTLFLTGCTVPNEISKNEPENAIVEATPMDLEFSGLGDENLLTYLEDSVYTNTIQSLNNTEYVVEEVQAIYISKEYIEEVAFNSQSNIYFGYSIEDLSQQFEGNKYIFTLDAEGKTIAQELTVITNTDSQAMLKNVLIGSGVILLCTTVSIVSASAGAPVAITAIFAVSATTAKTMALSSAIYGAVVSGIVRGYQTGDLSEAFEAAALGASEGFKIGAFAGALTGGLSETFLLHLGTKGGLTMSEVAFIQMESNYPIDLIMKLNSFEQYEILKAGGHTAQMVNGKTALVRNIDLNYIDELTGKTNLQLMQDGKAPLDPTGQKYELHHIGQKNDSPLAILTQAEHRQSGNDAIWHTLTEGFENPSSQGNWQSIKAAFWKDFARLISGV